MDNLTISAVIIAIILVIIVFMLMKQKASANNKIATMTQQFTLVLHNEKAVAYCKSIHEKYPNLCAGIDFTLKEDGDNVAIEEWNSEHPRPD